MAPSIPEWQPRRARHPRKLTEALERIRRDAAPPTLLARVQGSWARAVGEPIADQAVPVGDRDGVITVRCRAAVWAAELTMLSEQLLAQVNRELSGSPRVRALRFTVEPG